MRQPRYTSLWIPFLALLCFGLMTSSAFAANSFKGAGDQANQEIANGFFIDSEVGLLTFLGNNSALGYGALVYKPGILVSIQLGAHIGDFAIFGKVGSTVTGNTACYSNASRCQTAKTQFPTAANAKLRDVPRQGVSVLAGIGARWDFLKLLDDRFRMHLQLDLLFHMIPPDSIPDDKLSRFTAADKTEFAAHLNPSIGGAAGLGVGLEYFFILKHFSVGANALGYYFFTPFMPKSLLGLAVLVSVDIKYTFW